MCCVILDRVIDSAGLPKAVVSMHAGKQTALLLPYC